MRLIDFHTHLDWYEDQIQLINQFAGFKGTVIAASVDEKSFLKNEELAKTINSIYPEVTVIPTMGFHPQNADKFETRGTDPYFQYCNRSPIIGEIGLDFCWCKEVLPEKQETAFRYFLQYCHEKEKYCVIHTKDAEEKIARILEEFPKAKPIIHWYDGPEDVYKEFINRKYFQTFGCETSRSKHIQNLLKQTPLSLILAETDNPTSEPWLGGSDNSIYLIERIYKDIAEVCKISVETLQTQIAKNVDFILNNNKC